MKNILHLTLILLFLCIAGKAQILEEKIRFGKTDNPEIKLYDGTFYELSWAWESVGDNSRWLSGVNWGGAIFFGGLDYGYNFFGSSITDSSMIPSIEIRFSASEISKSATYRRDLGYPYPFAGIGDFPGSAWDISNPENPRRLNICFVEYQDTTKEANLIWDPDSASEIGNREYLFIMNSDYNESGDYDDTNFGPESDVLYALWPSIRGGHNYMQSDGSLFIYNIEIRPRNETIQNIQTVADPGTNDVSPLIDQVVTVRGMAMTGPRDIWSAGWVCYIIDQDNYPDPWSGLRIFQGDTLSKNGFGDIVPGEVYEFTGRIYESYGNTVLSIITNPIIPINKISTDVLPIPAPIEISASDLLVKESGEKWESMLVKTGPVRLGYVDIPFAISFTDDMGNVGHIGGFFDWFYDGLESGSYSWPEPLSHLNITGFLMHEFGLYEVPGNYFIYPRTADDLEIVSDSDPPIIEQLYTGSVALNRNVTVNASIRELAISSVRMKHRKGGESEFTEVEMTGTFNKNEYSAIIPAADVTSKGVEYYIAAEDVSGNMVKSDHRMLPLRIPAGEVSMTPYQGGSEENAYRMISVPYHMDNPQSIFSSLGEYDKFKWRVFYDNGTDFIEYDNLSENLVPPLAFWFIAKENVTLQPGAGEMPAMQNFATINLHPGWNQIGLPLNFPVSWADILTYNSSPNINGPYLYEGSHEIKTTLEPFKGYYVSNQTGSDFNLKIPFQGVSAVAEKKKSELDGWQARIHATAGNAQDHLNIIGVSSEANDEWDRQDQLEPPPIGSYISLYFNHTEWQEYPGNYAIDIRKQSDTGLIWDFEIKTNIYGRLINLDFSELSKLLYSGEINQDFKILLIDPQLQITRLLTDDANYSYIQNKKAGLKKLRLLIGTEEFVENQNLDIPLVPESYQLFQNFPNPFNPLTTIRFALPTEDKISLTVYNLLGEEIKTLVSEMTFQAGYHSVDWHGDDLKGRQVASGLYIYQLRTQAGTVAQKKMILIR